ncbi:MAG: META domain-containing protein [Phycisphaerae bacterium]|nr:META domain-containing protein [Phycisphaerae bacterium]
MHRTLLAALTTIAVAVTLAGCASEPKTSETSTPRDAEKTPPADAKEVPPADVQTGVPRDLVGDWTLLSFDAKLVSVAPDAHNAPAMTVMADGSLAGGGGVNRWSSKVDVKALAKKRFEASMPFSTMMAGDPDTMKLESAFMRAITNARTYDVTAGTLFLFGADGRELLAFRRK